MSRRLILALSVLALMGTLVTSKAHATLIIALQQAGVNAGARTNVAVGADFTSALYGFPVAATYGDFTFTILGASSNNTASMSDLLSATVSVKNNSGVAKTIKVWVTQDNYTLPNTSPLHVESGMSGTVNTGGIVLTGIFQAYLDSNNNQFGTSDYTNGLQNSTLTGSTFDTGSATGLAPNPNFLYSLTSEATLTLDPGSVINFSAHVNVTAVPVPTGIVMASMGAVLMGLGALRLRSAKKVLA